MILPLLSVALLLGSINCATFTVSSSFPNTNCSGLPHNIIITQLPPNTNCTPAKCSSIVGIDLFGSLTCASTIPDPPSNGSYASFKVWLSVNGCFGLPDVVRFLFDDLFVYDFRSNISKMRSVFPLINSARPSIYVKKMP